MNMLNQFLWVIFPYVMITISIVGLVFRYKTDQMSWSARSSEFLEKRELRWGSILFHYGIIFVFFGHVVGILVPARVVSGLGINDDIYHLFAVVTGGLAGLIATFGIILLIKRRFGNERILVTSSFSDKLLLILLFLSMGVGLYNTLIFNLFIGGFDYRTTLAPWLRSLFIFSPNPQLMVDVPLSYQIHVLIAFLVVGIWPFSRLVHILSIPTSFIYRANILFREEIHFND